MRRLLLLVSLFPLSLFSQYPFKPKEGTKKQFGYYNTGNNTWKIKPQFSYAEDFNENGFALACKKDKCGCIDTSGKIIIPFEYGLNFFYFKSKGPSFNAAGNIIMAKALSVTDAVYGMLDSKGKIILPFKYATDYHSFDPAAKYHVLGEYPGHSIAENPKWGLVNQKGEIIIPFMYDNLRKVNDTCYVAFKAKNCGLVDNENKILMEFKYSNIYEPEAAKGNLYVTENNLVGVIDFNGKTIVPAKYKIVSVNSLRQFVGYNKNEVNLYDLTGSLLNDRPYTGCAPTGFNNQAIAYLKTGDNETKAGVIDTRAKTLVPFEYDNLSAFGDKYYVAKKNNHYGLIDSSGNTIHPFKWDSVFGNRFLVDKKWGLINAHGTISIPPLYTTLRNVRKRDFSFKRTGLSKHGDSLLVFSLNGKTGLIHFNGKILAEINAANIADVITNNDKTYLIVLKDKKYGITDLQGNVLHEFEFDVFDSDEHLYMRYPGGYVFSKDNLHFTVDWETLKFKKYKGIR